MLPPLFCFTIIHYFRNSGVEQFSNRDYNTVKMSRKIFSEYAPLDTLEPVPVDST